MMFLETKRQGEAPAVREPWQSYLLNVANFLEQHDWCQHHVRRGNQFCLIGAMTWCKGFRDEDIGPAAIERFINYVGRSVPHWNDAPGRTKAEVLSTLRACAAAK